MATHNYSFSGNITHEMLLRNVTTIHENFQNYMQIVTLIKVCVLIETQCHGYVPTRNTFDGTNKCGMLVKSGTMHENMPGFLWQPFVCFLDESLFKNIIRNCDLLTTYLYNIA